MYCGLLKMARLARSASGWEKRKDNALHDQIDPKKLNGGENTCLVIGCDGGNERDYDGGDILQ